VNLPPILLGTSSFTASGWAGSFHPKGMRPVEYLTFYAQHFQTVEIDSTFYACPSPQTVSNWASRTPDGFIFSVKVPQVITHEKVLAGCDAEFREFLKTMDVLGTKLGPIIFQFPFFGKSAFRDRHEFLACAIFRPSKRTGLSPPRMRSAKKSRSPLEPLCSFHLFRRDGRSVGACEEN
jgi:uncharacterized protein YecE (DUF72 family)